MTEYDTLFHFTQYGLFPAVLGLAIVLWLTRNTRSHVNGSCAVELVDNHTSFPWLLNCWRLAQNHQQYLDYLRYNCPKSQHINGLTW